MRPRHWELLRKATGKEFVPPHEDEDLQLGGLLSLNLHEFNTDVEEICDQATKEEKIEVRSQRHAVDARRLRERMVSLSSLRRFARPSEAESHLHGSRRWRRAPTPSPRLVAISRP